MTKKKIKVNLELSIQKDLNQRLRRMNYLSILKKKGTL